MESTGVLDAQLLVRATAAAGLAKTAVDVIRTQRDLYSWVSPLAALMISFLILCLLSEANGIPIDSRQSFASAALGAFIAAPLAIGATAVQSAVERKTSDQKVAEVQDIAATQVQRVAAISTSNATADEIEAASRRGAQMVIDELRAGKAA